jgi:hypothetical protein
MAHYNLFGHLCGAVQYHVLVAPSDKGKNVKSAKTSNCITFNLRFSFKNVGLADNMVFLYKNTVSVHIYKILILFRSVAV